MTTTSRSNRQINVVVAIGYHSYAQDLPSAITSALQLNGLSVRVLILDSSPNGDALVRMGPYALDRRITIKRRLCKRAYSSRNNLIRIANTMTTCTWLIRLDADDTLVPDAKLVTVLKHCSSKYDAVLAGNVQVNSNNRVIGHNYAIPGLLRPAVLLKRLTGMASGRFKDELPSCNLVLRLPCSHFYPAIRSAEDHFLLTKLLLKCSRRIKIARCLLLTRYKVGGTTTVSNLQTNSYIKSRQKILEWAKSRAA
jgi:hypothetical protein